MRRDVNTTGAAARALSARNPAAFDCVHSLEESIRLLAAITDPPKGLDILRGRGPSFGERLDVPMVPLPKRPNGTVDANAVRLDWDDAVRFEGRWTASLDRVKLEGTMASQGLRLPALVPLGFVVFAAAMALVNGAYWLLAILGLLVVVGMPLLVAALGSARVAAEIELERIIGQAIGDPEKYASRWRRWQDE
ncbi:hypothetical protein DSM104443_00962 [Usitatibacter rugosus]|uniref:Uncharacterized protein n=1 Tax=Usitatibacter rugosus TaxID=2732067 RepID=A0A6M4GRN0_9PROT|nr:hypothetical protein [Usitatibacter rugosus]QJR09911.1 hypothetical protein DSM104443_00962 [Usitatibacter rugosus]